jgi:hypothetical protein
MLFCFIMPTGGNMRRVLPVVLAGISLLFCPVPVHAQGESAVPFLLITPSIDGNGMGGIGTSVGSDNATAPMRNPGQLGLFSLNNFFNAAFYTPKTNWLPQFNLPGLTYEAWALNAGVRINDFVDLPFRLSLGVGYAQVDLDLGRFTVTSSQGPTVISTFESWEESRNVTFGVGLDYLIKVSAGITFKSVESQLSPIGTESEQGGGKASVNARDYGIMALLPLPDLIEAAGGVSLEIVPKLRPLVDMGFGYARTNVGGSVVYIDAAQSDPLPRTAAIGTYIELGTIVTTLNPGWKPLSFMIVREAEDILVHRMDNGTWEYTTGLGDIQFSENVLLGKAAPNVGLRRGWQLQVGEMMYLRGGSVDSPGLQYETSGYTLRLGGLFKMLMIIAPGLRDEEWFRILADVLDLQYTSAKYSGGSSPIRDTSFNGINIVLRSIPFVQ